MEHISRRTTRDVDHLLLVTDTSQRGLMAVQTIIDMVPSMEVNIENMYLVINRVLGSQLPPALAAAVNKLGVELLGTIPNDEVMTEFEFTGRPLVELPNNTQVVQAVCHIADRILSNGR